VNTITQTTTAPEAKNSGKAKDLTDMLYFAVRDGADALLLREISHTAFRAAHDNDREALSVMLSAEVLEVRVHIPQASREALKSGHLETALWIIETAKLSADDFDSSDCRFDIALKKLADAVALATAIGSAEEVDELVNAHI
jgi:hypothetical protein